MATSTEIAERLRAAAERGPAAALEAMDAFVRDDGFEVRHEPAAPADGRLSKAQSREAGRLHTEILPSKIEDYRWESVDAEVDGDDVILSFVRAGTLPDGEALHIRSKMVMTIEDGFIARMRIDQDGNVSALQRLLADESE